MSPLRIIVTGLIGQHPHMGGVAWDYVQYPVGLRLLGHDVYYFEDSGEWPYNLDSLVSSECKAAKTPEKTLMALSRTMTRFGLQDRWAYRFPRNDTWHGLSDVKRREVMESADLLINVSGTIEYPERYRSVRRMAYIDTDPLFTQIKFLRKVPKFPSLIDSHDVHFSFGETFSPSIPVTGHKWRPTRQPILVDEWPTNAPFRNVYSTVMNWTSYSPIIHNEVAYGQKDVEFRKFLHLPENVAPAKLEVALANTEHINWQADSGEFPDNGKDNLRVSPGEVLRRTGWDVVDPEVCCGGLDEYRNYITSSKAEWSVAKNGYVQGRPGWFSCRSCCYLAAGRPVIVQDTGFSDVIPTGEGVLAFSNFHEAVEGIREVEAHYPRHARAAREIASAYFESGSVLKSLVERAMEATTNELPDTVPAVPQRQTPHLAKHL